MKKTISASLLALSFTATPALADVTYSPRVELRAGAEDIENGIGSNFAMMTKSISYGGAIGIDATINEKIVIGIEGTSDNLFSDHRDIGVNGRLGYMINPSVLVYGKAGWANYKNAFGFKFDGLRAGAGIEVEVLDPLYVGAEYQYTDLQHNYGKHGVFAKVGLKF